MIFTKLHKQQSVLLERWRKPAKTNGFGVLRYRVNFPSHFDFHFAITTLKMIHTLVINWSRLLPAPPPDCKRKSNVTLNSLSLPFGSFRHHCTLFQRLRTSGQDASSSTKQVQFGRQSDSVGSVVQESKIISVKLPVGGKNSKSNWTRLNQAKRVKNN